MLQAQLTIDKDFTIGSVDDRLYGAFIEHLGRCVYQGIYEPNHPAADADGFRTDVLDLVAELNPPVMRYPGGNFVSGYDWLDGVGPRAERPQRLELAWKSIETNQFGTDEFIQWCRRAHTDPMLAVNLGTAGPDQARQLVEYCNHPSGSQYSDLRRQHGHEQPHDVKLWCLGNEMDGPWQMGHKTADEYGRVAAEAARLMKMVDPTIELVACGSSTMTMPTFPAWEATVLEHTHDLVEYISLHTYFTNKEDDTPTFLAQPDQAGEFIQKVIATCDHVAARRRSTKRIMLSYDEWNVWFHCQMDPKQQRWQIAPPLLEDIYTTEDALVVGGMLITLLNHCHRVKIACLAQLVNVIAPIMTAPNGPAWRQTIFYPFAHASTLGRGTVLQTAVQSPTYENQLYPDTPYLKTACVLNEPQRELVLFALNRSLDQSLEVTLQAHGLGELSCPESQSTTLTHPNLKATNTLQAPTAVIPAPGPDVRCTPNATLTELPPASWNVIRLQYDG